MGSYGVIWIVRALKGGIAGPLHQFVFLTINNGLIGWEVCIFSREVHLIPAIIHR